MKSDLWGKRKIKENIFECLLFAQFYVDGNLIIYLAPTYYQALFSPIHRGN